jgi:hypothetical protein
MANNRVTIKIPRDAFMKLRMKKVSMEQRFKQVYGKQKNLPMTKLIRFISLKPIYIGDDELKYLFRGKMNIRRKGGGYSLV